MARHWRHKQKKEKKQLPVYIRKPVSSPFILYSVNAGHVCYGSWKFHTETVRWISTQDPDYSRIPREVHIRFNGETGFTAAGKTYRDITELFAKKAQADFPSLEELLDSEKSEYQIEHLMQKAQADHCWYQDIYGREVFYMIVQMFPDLDDTCANYDKYHRWFFIRQEDMLTRIYRNDLDREIYVTEDVAELEGFIWYMMKIGGFI